MRPKTWESNDDVISLLKAIKALVYGNDGAQNNYWMMQETLKECVNIK